MAPTVAIIGSFRKHYPDVLAAWDAFTSAGYEVSSPLGAPVTRGSAAKLFVKFESDPADWSDAYIESVALHRILRADFSYAVLPGGYVGRTTCYEIGRIIQAGRPIYFSERPTDLPIEIPESWILPTNPLIQMLAQSTVSPLEFDDPEHERVERALIEQEWLDI